MFLSHTISVCIKEKLTDDFTLHPSESLSSLVGTQKENSNNDEINLHM